MQILRTVRYDLRDKRNIDPEDGYKKKNRRSGPIAPQKMLAKKELKTRRRHALVLCGKQESL